MNSEIDAAVGGVLTIDLTAIAANWRLLASRMPDGKDCAAVVKADGYGLGAAKVGPALAQAGCREFFVALLDEGIALRRVLPDCRIYILTGPAPGTIERFRAYGLVPVLNSPEQVADWTEQTGGAPYALHVDTGMNRLGLTMAEFETVKDRLAPALVMSHLACAEEAGNPMNTQQLAAFQHVRQAFPNAVASFANSAGMFRGPEYLFDLGRPGVALYGAKPLPGQVNPMRPVVTLRLRILQVRRVDTPQTVGYGATRRLVAGTRVATVAAGYADGLLRAASNRGYGTLGDHRVDVVGRVSMDLITFDVSGIPESLAKPGAWITLLDERHGIDDLAAEAETVSYEILTSLGPRYARRYVGEISGSETQ